MKAGASQIDITPPTGVELSGFVCRQQPSVGVHDSLYAKALFLDDEAGGELLWIHADTIGFESEYCDALRQQLAGHLGIDSDQVLVSATHTHSGPPTLPLNNCGTWGDDDHYRSALANGLIEAGLRATRSIQPVELCFGGSACDVSFDRRGFASAHVDRRCSAIGVKRTDGTFLAAVANYSCHPVALGSENRQVSGDIFGYAARKVSTTLAGTPVVLFTNGACGNLNPPRVGDDFPGCEALGHRIGNAVVEAITGAEPLAGLIHSKEERLEITSDITSFDGAKVWANAIRARFGSKYDGCRDKALRAIQAWESRMEGFAWNEADIDLRLYALRIGELQVACLGAEAFSIIGDELRARCGEPLFVVGYANGELGYLCPESAYEDGGYEVEDAFVFYNTPPIRKGEFERAAARLTELVNSLAY